MTDDTWSETLSEHKSRQADHIAEAALSIIASDGMSALSMSSIAEQAGIARQTLYRYYPDVEAVLIGAMRSAAVMEEHINALTPQDGTPLERLTAMVEAILEGAAQGHPSVARYEQSLPPEARMEAHRHADRIRLLLAELLASGVEEGSFAAHLDPAIDAAILLGMINAAHDLVAESDNPGRPIARVLAIVERMVQST